MQKHLSYPLGQEICIFYLSHSHFLHYQNTKLKPFPKQALALRCMQYKSFENTVRKEEIARNEQFYIYPQCFLPVRKPFAIFIKFEIVDCKLFQFGRV